MPGFNSSRFIDLSEREAKHLNCSICLSIFDDPVISGCGHTFCIGCIYRWIVSGQNECPECRNGFRSNKSDHNLNQSLIVISEFEFIRDFKSKTIINELMTFCDFQFQGCNRVIEFGSLEAHLKQCEHRLCNTCGIGFKKEADHNCTELLLEDRNIWKEEVVRLDNEIKGSLQRYNKLEVLYYQQIYDLNETKLKNIELTKYSNQLRTENLKLLNDLNLPKDALNEKRQVKDIPTLDSNKQLNDMKIRTNQLAQQLNKIKTEKSKLVLEMYAKDEWISQLDGHMNGVILHTSRIMFGTHSSTNYNNISLDSVQMFFYLRDNSDINFNIKYICITKMLFCSNPSISVIFLKLGRNTSKNIRKGLLITDRTSGWFDSRANDPSETYVTLKFRFESCATLLRLAINNYWYKSKSTLKCQLIDEDTARQMLAMARK